MDTRCNSISGQPNSPLSRPSVVAQILQERGIDPKYSYGQNFLVNDKIIGKILDVADVRQGDNVLEIGPGMGVLTLALLNSGAQVIAVEKDPEMIEILSDNVERYCPELRHNLQIVNDDALNIDYVDIESMFAANIERDASAGKQSSLSAKDTDRVKPDFKLIANLPYAVAATIILNAFQQSTHLVSTTTMVQKEVADRIAAKPNSKDYGAYTVKLAFYAKPSQRFNVAPNNFFPAPRVTSTVIKLEREAASDPNTIQTACLLADAAFSHRRKTIQNSIKQYFADIPNTSFDLLEVINAFSEVNINLKARAETLSTSDYLNVADILI